MCPEKCFARPNSIENNVSNVNGIREAILVREFEWIGLEFCEKLIKLGILLGIHT